MEIRYLPQVRKFVLNLEEPLRSRVFANIDLLEEYGHLLGMPSSKALGKGLFELRTVGNDHVRIFYCFHKEAAHLLLAIKKKSQQLSQKDLKQAVRAMKLVVAV
jgi:phage-related protein